MGVEYISGSKHDLKNMPLRNADKYRGWSKRRRRWTLAKIWMIQTFSIIWMVRGPRDENVLSTSVRSPRLIDICPYTPYSFRAVESERWCRFDQPEIWILMRWPINQSNQLSDFLRLDLLDRFAKIIKSIFRKFWKWEFQILQFSEFFIHELYFSVTNFILTIEVWKTIHWNHQELINVDSLNKPQDDARNICEISIACKKCILSVLI